jgi:hypothetical protein
MTKLELIVKAVRSLQLSPGRVEHSAEDPAWPGEPKPSLKGLG